jgi:uncharacterized protein (UPF0332 family)
VTLHNLLKIGQLRTHEARPDEIARLLAAAKRNLADAENEQISAEARFDMAYRAIMQVSLIALMANGYRPSTSQPGHHQTLVYSLVHTLRIEARSASLLDALRKRRNAADYQGDLVSEPELEYCISQSRDLLRALTSWLSREKPSLAG